MNLVIQQQRARRAAFDGQRETIFVGCEAPGLGIEQGKQGLLLKIPRLYLALYVNSGRSTEKKSKKVHTASSIKYFWNVSFSSWHPPPRFSFHEGDGAWLAVLESCKKPPADLLLLLW